MSLSIHDQSRTPGSILKQNFTVLELRKNTRFLGTSGLDGPRGMRRPTQSVDVHSVAHVAQATWEATDRDPGLPTSERPG